MHKLIPTIYFYVVSLIGLVLLIIGIFSSIHFLVGITAYDKYPLGYSAETRCIAPAPEKGQPQVNPSYNQCLQEVEQDRMSRKADDMEKSISFTLVGLIVFGIHFYFARKQTKANS